VSNEVNNIDIFPKMAKLCKNKLKELFF